MRKRSMSAFCKKINSFIVNECAPIKTMTNKVDHKEYLINTIYGELNINVYDHVSQVYTVFTRFNNVALAKEHLPCNPFSGKWNFHLSFDKVKKNEADQLSFDVISSTIKNILV